MLERGAIFGVCGGFGRLFAKSLHSEDVTICGVDRSAEQDDTLPLDAYICEDGATLSEAALAHIEPADLVLLCLPEDALAPVLDKIAPVLNSRMVLVDTTSVKSPWVAHLQQRDIPCELLSLNPMFAPDLGFGGQDIAAVEVRSGPRSRELLTLLERWDSRVVTLSEGEHDKRAAMSQVATHAAVLAYGAALAGLGFEFQHFPTTPPQRAMLRLFARIASLEPEVYWHIQHDNPFAEEARQAVARALEGVEIASVASDSRAFRQLVEEGKSIFASELDEFFQAFVAGERALRPPGKGDLKAESM